MCGNAGWRLHGRTGRLDCLSLECNLVGVKLSLAGADGTVTWRDNRYTGSWNALRKSVKAYLTRASDATAIKETADFAVDEDLEEVVLTPAWESALDDVQVHVSMVKLLTDTRVMKAQEPDEDDEDEIDDSTVPTIVRRYLITFDGRSPGAHLALRACQQ